MFSVLLFQVSGSMREIKLLAKKNTDFAIKFYTALQNFAPGENIAFSPISLSYSMALMHLGSHGDTKKQISNVFNFEDEYFGNGSASIYSNFKRILQMFKHPSNNYTLTILNRLYGTEGYHYQQEFFNQSDEYFQSGFATADFVNNADSVRLKINEWVSDVTEQRIPNILPPSILSPSTVLFLLNVIYFNGIWLHPFNYHKTSKGEFYINKETSIDMDMMKIQGYFRYADVSERYRYRILELPYLGERASMFILLPTQIGGLAHVERHLKSSDFEDVIDNFMKRYKVDVTIPRFQIQQHFNLRAILSTMGLKDLFLPGAADLSSMAHNKGLYLTEFLHSTFLQVNEVGTEASSISGFKIGLTSLVSNPTFVVNSPFLYIIREKATGSTLFMGRLVKPSDKVAEIGIYPDGRFDKDSSVTLEYTWTSFILLIVLHLVIQGIIK